MLYSQLFVKIKETLDKVERVKISFSDPQKPDKFPAVFFAPAGFTSSFETRNENLMYFRFIAEVLVSCSKQTQAAAFGTVLPNVVDEIVAQFAADWNGGVIGGHRVTMQIDSADSWYITEADGQGLIAVAPLNIQIMVLVNTGA